MAAADPPMLAPPAGDAGMTFKELLQQSARDYGANVALRYKAAGAWQTRTYRQLQQRIWCAAEAFVALGLRPGDRLALLLENRPEWPEIYLAATGVGLMVVPADDKLQTQEVAHILRDSGARTLVTTAARRELLPGRPDELPALETIVVLDSPGGTLNATHGIRTLAYETALQQAEAAAHGSRRAYDRFQPAPADLAALIYTSGTTGRPKGAMLSHRNFISNVKGMLAMFDVRPDDNFLLVLPLHHAFAFNTNLILPLARGAAITFVENLKTVGDDMRATAPTVLIAVPLLLEKMYQRILNGLREHPAGRLLLALGLLRPLRRRIRARFGGRLRLLVSGGAPCDAALLRGFMRLGLDILEGYGLTETAPVLTLNPMGRSKPGSVGPPLPGVEVKIMEPDADGVGEIVARGPNVMRGYYNNPAATAAVFRDDWFLTGDLGYLDAEGYAHITGRKKNLIVNREGKNINPEEVEAQVLKSPFIREALALGYRDPDERVGEHIGLLVVPDAEALQQHAARENRSFSAADVEHLIRREVHQFVSGIAAYKRPRRIVLRQEEFEKTSTGKVKRYLHTTLPAA